MVVSRNGVNLSASVELAICNCNDAMQLRQPKTVFSAEKP